MLPIASRGLTTGCTTVGCPPAPLQRARRAPQVRRDLVAHLIGAHARRQIPTTRVCLVDRLTITAGIVQHTITGRGGSLQLVHVQATLCIRNAAIQMLVANAELEETFVMGCHFHKQSHRLARHKTGHWAALGVQKVAVAPLSSISADPSAVATLRTPRVRIAPFGATSHGREFQQRVRCRVVHCTQEHGGGQD
jgi:hypothetical protein